MPMLLTALLLLGAGAPAPLTDAELGKRLAPILPPPGLTDTVAGEEGKKLDAWLIYKCSSCDRTWKCAIFSRVDTSRVDRCLLQRLQANHRPTAWAYAFDYALLRRNGVEVEPTIAYTIVGTASELEEVTESEVIKYSAGGFRDFTRIAASDPVMWRDVFLANREAVLATLQRFNEDLTVLQQAIRRGDGTKLEDWFTRTRAIRRSIIEQGQDDAAPDFGRRH